jgi:hypothetical protein
MLVVRELLVTHQVVGMVAEQVMPRTMEMLRGILAVEVVLPTFALVEQPWPIE